MWARLNKRGGTHVNSGEGWKKKKTDCRRATTTESTTMWRRRSSAPMCDAVDVVFVLLGSLARLPGFDCGLKCWSVGLQNEWMQLVPTKAHHKIHHTHSMPFAAAASVAPPARRARHFASGCCRKKKKGRRQRHRAFLLMCLFTPASVGPPTERVAASWG